MMSLFWNIFYLKKDLEYFYIIMLRLILIFFQNYVVLKYCQVF
jgi:hypothetical protein